MQERDFFVTLHLLAGKVRRALAGWAFYTTKLRIQPILQWVYVNEEQVQQIASSVEQLLILRVSYPKAQ